MELDNSWCKPSISEKKCTSKFYNLVNILAVFDVTVQVFFPEIHVDYSLRRYDTIAARIFLLTFS